MIHITKNIIYLLGVIALLATGCTPHATAPTRVRGRTLSPTKKIVLDGTVLSVQVATTFDEQQHGLSGIQSIQPDEGMLFPYSQPTHPTFWMKGMLFPIDIIWIRNGRVIDIEPNLPPPNATQTEDDLTRYTTTETVTAVLEVQAGWTTTHGIQTGSIVTE